MDRILIIEDDRGIAEIERDYLELSGYEVVIEADGTEGCMEAQKGSYQLILLDVMLPGMDGFQICRVLRETLDIPILMVTARLDDVDKIRGLGLGADDYIEKPFSPAVLVARVRANLSQYRRLKQNPSANDMILGAGSLKLNPVTRDVTVDEKPVILKNKEYELLHFLMSHPNVVFGRDVLYERIWGMDALGDNATVAVHINRLREKLGEDPGCPAHIQTVRGAGYRYHD